MTKANRKTKATGNRASTAKPKITLDKKAGVGDMYANPAANVGFGTTSLVNGGRHVPFRISLDYQRLVFMYRGSWIIRKVVDTKPQDQLKAFPTITGKLTPEDIAAFDRVIASTCTLQKYIEGRKWGRLFGGALGRGRRWRGSQRARPQRQLTRAARRTAVYRLARITYRGWRRCVMCDLLR